MLLATESVQDKSQDALILCRCRRRCCCCCCCHCCHCCSRCCRRHLHARTDSRGWYPVFNTNQERISRRGWIRLSRSSSSSSSVCSGTAAVQCRSLFVPFVPRLSSSMMGQFSVFLLLLPSFSLLLLLSPSSSLVVCRQLIWFALCIVLFILCCSCRHDCRRRSICCPTDARFYSDYLIDIASKQRPGNTV